MPTKVVTFGEIMIRMSTPNHLRFIQADSFNVTYGGGEANVAVSLAHFGIEACFVTKVPNNPIGQAAINHLRRYGVKTDNIIRGGDRLGIYYLETGASQRPSVVVYDRANSAISQAEPGEYDWSAIFKGVSWFHVTGITPALDNNTAQATLEACRTARELGATVSCDLNYRKKLWSQERAGRVLAGLMPHVDIVVANEEDAEKVFGIKSPSSDMGKGRLNKEGYREVARQLRDRFNLRCVAITLRQSYSASYNGWSGMLYDGKDCYLSREYKIHVVDRVGGGDSFAAGIIFGFLQQWNPQKIVDFSAAASCLKQTIPGDFNMASIGEVKNLVEGETSGRIQR